MRYKNATTNSPVPLRRGKKHQLKVQSGREVRFQVPCLHVLSDKAMSSHNTWLLLRAWARAEQ